MTRFLLIVILSLALKKSTGQTRSLDYFVTKAIAFSPLLKDLQNQVKINKLDSLLIIATQFPQVSFTSNNNYAPVIKGYGYDNAITNGANVSALIGVRKSLLNSLGNKVQFANLQLLSNALINNLTISEQDIKRSVIGQYIVVYGDLLQVNFSTEIQDMLQKQEKVLKTLTQKNVYKQVDYLTFFVTLQQNGFKLKQQVNQYKNDYATLNYLAGIADTTQLLIEKPEVAVKILPDIK